MANNRLNPQLDGKHKMKRKLMECVTTLLFNKTKKKEYEKHKH